MRLRRPLRVLASVAVLVCLASLARMVIYRHRQTDPVVNVEILDRDRQESLTASRGSHVNQGLLPISPVAKYDNGTDAEIEDGHPLELELARRWRKRERPCSSPEFGKEWMLGNCPANESVGSGTSNSTCGLCSQNTYAVAFQKIAAHVQKMKASQCSGLVVYGAVFGDMYYKKYQDETWAYGLKLKRRGHPNATTRAWHKLHSTCFITFVLAQSLKAYPFLPKQNSMDFLDKLIPVPMEALPYENHRRNVKLFKFLGPFLFPWAKRLIWQDGEKFRRPGWEDFRPANYLKYFEEAIQRNDVCVAFIQAPRHTNYFGSDAEHLSQPRLDKHCRAIVQSSLRRNTTDSSVALTQQCSYYYSHSSNSYPSDRVFSRLVDSAFIAWDLRSARCKQFNLQLGCTWLDEIHCFSDRDQPSFPVALASMGVLDSSPDVTWPSRNHRLLVDSEQRPIVQLISPLCHWYYHRLEEDASACLLRLGRLQKQRATTPSTTRLQQTTEMLQSQPTTTPSTTTTVYNEYNNNHTNSQQTRIMTFD